MKVTIDGQVYEYDGDKAPVSEALAIEDVYKRRYVEWQSDLQAGSAKAMCVLAWIIWRRAGREVPFEDIIEGRADFDLGEMIASILESAAADAAAEAAAEPDPTVPPAPAGTPGTKGNTRESSPSTSTSGRGKSRSSKSGNSSG